MRTSPAPSFDGIEHGGFFPGHVASQAGAYRDFQSKLTAQYGGAKDSLLVGGSNGLAHDARWRAGTRSG